MSWFTKGIRRLRNIRRAFLRYTPAIEIRIHRDRLIHNFRAFRKKYSGTRIAPVLKSNAYGHGLIEVARILDRQRIAFLTVDSLYEAMILRRHGIRAQILVIGYTSVDNILGNKLRHVAFTITSLGQLEELARCVTLPVIMHLKIDTGMCRQGILPAEIPRALELISSNQRILFEGICSHFANADDSDPAFTQAQLETWRKAKVQIEAQFPDLVYKHIAATSGAFHATVEDGNVIRVGIGLFGIDPSSRLSLGLRPVLEMRTVIGSVKKVPAGECVGYGLTYQTEGETILATIPVGYFEGLDRRLSNIGMVKVKGVPCPIIGSISMNIATIDVTRVPDVRVGDPVMVISSKPHDPCSLESHAKAADTIPYELLVHIPQHLRRTVIS